MRFVALVCLFAALYVGACRGEDVKPYPYPAHIHTMTGVDGYYDLNGLAVLPPSVSFSLMGQTGTGRPIDATMLAINDSKSPLYLNGVKYDYDNRVEGATPNSNEVLRWYSFTGYFKATKRQDGGWDFDTIDGKEERCLWERNIRFVQDPAAKAKHESAWKELGHTGIMKKRPMSMSECRSLWKKELTGEHKWSRTDNGVWSYVEVHAAMRKPLVPQKFDPRGLPLIAPDI